MKNLQKGSVNVWSVIIIVAFLIVAGYFMFMKKVKIDNQETTPLSKVQSQDSVSVDQSQNNQLIVPVASTQTQDFNVSSKVNSHDTRGSQVSYSVGGESVMKDSRFGFWKITILCTSGVSGGITARDSQGNNVCNLPNTLRTNEDFNVTISNSDSKEISFQAKAELLSEKDRSISIAQTFVDTSVIPALQGSIIISSPISDQVMSLGSTERIKFSAPYDINGKTISISATNGEVIYYLSDLNQTIYSNPMSYNVEFSWNVGKYSHNSVTNRSGTLPAGDYKLKVIDGNWSSDYVSVVIK